MNKYLLKTLAVIAPLTVLLASCGGVGEGTDYGFNGKDEVVFDDESLDVVVDEDQGIITIDLLDGASAGGKDLSGSTDGVGVSQVSFTQESIIWDPNAENNDEPLYGLPVPTIVKDGKQVTPFFLDGNSMHVVLEGFDERLSTCSEWDPENPPENPWPRQSHMYTVTYNVLNGAVPAERTMNITINAVAVDTASITGANMTVQGGQTVAAEYTVMPSAACPNLTFTMADPAIASVDASGNVTGLTDGTTTLTITDPVTGVSGDIQVTVDNKFKIAVTSADGPSDALTKEFPACVTGALRVEPTPAYGEDLSGIYDFSWSPEDDAVAAGLGFGAIDADGFSQWSYIALNGGGKTAEANMNSGPVSVTVRLTGGATSTPVGNVNAVPVAVSVVENESCYDTNTDGVSWISWDHTFSDPNFWHWTALTGDAGEETVTRSVNADSHFGHSLELIPVTDATEHGAIYANWNKNLDGSNRWAVQYGHGAAGHNKQIKAAAWVKLSTAKTGVIARLYFGAWHDSALPGGVSSSFSEMTTTGPEFSAELAATTEWQYVEFVDRAWTPTTTDDSPIFTIPSTWAADGTNWTSVMPAVAVQGLVVGETILFDDIAIYEVQ